MSKRARAAAAVAAVAVMMLAAGCEEVVPTAEPTPVAASLGEVIRSYEANPVAAGFDYDGKRMSVEGTVHSIEIQRAWYGTAYIVVVESRAGGGEYAACVVDDAHAQEVAVLAKGDRVNAVGETSRRGGYEPRAMTTTGAVVLHDCRIMAPGEGRAASHSEADRLPADCRELVRAPAGAAISAQEALCNSAAFRSALARGECPPGAVCAAGARQREDAFQTRLAAGGTGGTPKVTVEPPQDDMATLIAEQDAVSRSRPTATPHVPGVIRVTGLVVDGYREKGGDYVVVLRVEDGTMGCRLDERDGNWSAVELGHTVSVSGWTRPGGGRDLDWCRLTAHAP